LLHGVTPFPQETLEEAQKRMKKGEIAFSDHLSIEAKKLMTEILDFNPKMRPSIQMIRGHSWIKKM
jgi:hypothetical protein